MIGEHPSTRPVRHPLLKPAMGMFWGGVALGVLGIALLGLEPSLGGLLLAPAGLLMLGLYLPLAYDWLRGRSERDDRALLAAELADLLELGVPVPEALDRLHHIREARLGSRFGRVNAALGEVVRPLHKGSDLAASVSGTGVFPAYWETLIRNGERQGRLPEALHSLSTIECENASLPAFLVVRLLIVLPLIAGVIAFLSNYILPTFVQLHEGMSVELPGSTQLLRSVARSPLLGLADLLIGLIILLIALGILYPGVGSLFQRLLFRVPGLWRLFRLGQQGRIARAMAGAAALDVPEDEILETGLAAAEHPAYVKALIEMRERHGEHLSERLDQRPDLFASELRWLVREGERFENLGEALQVCGDHLSREYERARVRAFLYLDTAVLGALGALVLLVALGSLSPLFKLIGTMSGGLLP